MNFINETETLVKENNNLKALIQNENEKCFPLFQDEEKKVKNQNNEAIILIVENIMQYFDEKIQKTKKKIFKIIKNNSKFVIFFLPINFLNYKFH